MGLRRAGFDAHTVPISRIKEFVSGPSSSPAGVAILDLDLGTNSRGWRLRGADLIAELRQRRWTVLVVSAAMEKTEVAAAIAAGAQGFVPKSTSFDRLTHAVTAAVNGKSLLHESQREQWLAVHSRHQTQVKETTARLARLTVREREVLELMSGGQRVTRISEHLGVSMMTVRSHIRSILSKLQVHSQVEAIALARPPVAIESDSSGWGETDR
jgi:DNA-binding NarL/FixJ family response regulator